MLYNKLFYLTLARKNNNRDHWNIQSPTDKYLIGIDQTSGNTNQIGNFALLVFKVYIDIILIELLPLQYL